MKFLKNHPFATAVLLFVSGISMMSGFIFSLHITAYVRTVYDIVGMVALMAFSLYYYICYFLRTIRYESDICKDRARRKKSAAFHATSLGMTSTIVIFTIINTYGVVLSLRSLWIIIGACHIITIICLELVERVLYPRPAKTQAPSENKVPRK